MKKSIWLLLAGVLALVAVVAAQPGPGSDSGGNGMGADKPMMHRGGPMMHNRLGQRGERMGMLGQMAEKLELTDAQKSQLAKMRTDFQLLMVDKQADLRKAQIRLRSTMADDKSAESEVLKGIDDVARIRTDIAKSRFSHSRQMKGVLTDKQRETLKGMRHPGMRMWGIGDQGGDDQDHSGGMPAEDSDTDTDM